MKTESANLFHLKKLGAFIGKIATALVSGLPREKVVLKPGNRSTLETRKEIGRPVDEKYHHRPIGKPAVEKQTLLKEKKK